MEDYKLIPLKGGQFAIVDPEDYEYLSQHKWHCNHDGYAKRTGYHPDGRSYTVLMHRFIINAPKEMCVDHTNRNRLDNRRQNLRLCTRSQNAINRQIPQKSKTSKYKGVHQKPGSNRWCAVIGRKNSSRDSNHIGIFDTEEEAARYHDAAARFYYGEFAITNFPGDEALSVEEIQQMIQHRFKSKCSSVFKGVYRHKASGKWVAYVNLDRKRRIHIGTFVTEEEAAIARDQKVKELGIKTRLNFPD